MNRIVYMVKKVSSSGPKTAIRSEGYIGKSVPCTPTLVGLAVLNQYLSRREIVSTSLLLAKEERRRL